MRNETRVRLLRIVLIATGAVLCLCGLLLMMPGSWLRRMGGLFVGAEALDSVWPESGYVLRTTLAAYLWIGIVLLVTASDPTRYWRLVDVAICMLFVLAVVCAVSGVTGGVPAPIYLGDAVPSFVAAALLLALRVPRGEARTAAPQ